MFLVLLYRYRYATLNNFHEVMRGGGEVRRGGGEVEVR